MKETAIAFCVMAAIFGSACQEYERIRQVRTYADLQTIVARVEAVRSADDETPLESHIASVAKSVADGRDAWGEPFIWQVKETGGGWSYIVGSYGSDSKPDVDNPEKYFDIESEDIGGEAERDIIFRDGEPVTRAGK